MRRERGSFGNERGIALIIGLLVLLVLTLIGISAINTTTFENRISGNERAAAEAFYTAEAGLERGLAQLPSTAPIPVTSLTGGSSYWSGGPKDKGDPKSFIVHGDYVKGGDRVTSGTDVADESPGTYTRYQVNATGESFGSMKEVEVQVLADIH